MTKMVTYNIPPHLNWLLKFSNSQPFVMYIAEFNHYLTKQDLADIWQNTMPSIAKNVELQTTSLEHVLDFNQLFEGIDLTSIDNMKGVVFKAKKRASNNYYDLTAQADDQPSNLRIPWYSYNWPYDYFSLVELVNIKAGEVYQPQVDVTQQAIKSIIQSGGKILDAGSKDITNSPQDLKNFLNNLGSNKNG